MPLEIRCVYCSKPLIDADNARAHVVNQCEASPARKLADALQRLCGFICESLERRSMNSAALEAEWHVAHEALKEAGRKTG